MRENEQNHPAVPEKEKPRPAEDPRRQSLRTVVWAVGGGYLLYLVYQLAKGVIEGAVDRTGRIVSICACVVFTAAAVIMLVSAVRLGLRTFRASVDAMTAAAAEEAAAPEALPDPDGDMDQDEE